MVEFDSWMRAKQISRLRLIVLPPRRPLLRIRPLLRTALHLQRWLPDTADIRSYKQKVSKERLVGD